MKRNDSRQLTLRFIIVVGVVVFEVLLLYAGGIAAAFIGAAVLTAIGLPIRFLRGLRRSPYFGRGKFPDIDRSGKRG